VPNWSTLRLVATVKAHHLPLDDWLFSPLIDWRAAAPRLGDGLWVRLLDVPRALAARRYAAPVDLVLDVEDPWIPANNGRWRLRGGRDSAEVSREDEARADIVGGIEGLSAVCLGGTGVATTAGAGLLRGETPGALEALDAALHAYRAPGVASSF
jgi:predicted acetyltransferase